MGPRLVPGGGDAEITGMTSMLLKSYKNIDGHSGKEKVILEDQAITGEKAALTFDSLINFAERQPAVHCPQEQAGHNLDLAI